MTAQLLQGLIAIAALLCLLLVWDKSYTGSVAIYSAQAAIVGLVGVGAAMDGGPAALLLAIVALLSKAVGIPLALKQGARRLGASASVDPLYHTPASLLISFALLVLGNGLAAGPVAQRSAQGLAIGISLVGIWLVCSRRGAFSQIIGLLVVENGASLLISVSGELRVVSEVMLLIEALAAPAALLLLVRWLCRRAGTVDTDSLRVLTELPESEEPA